MDFSAQQAHAVAVTEAYLHEYFAQLPTQPSPLLAAMRYASLNGGKRVRPLLVQLVAHMLDVPQHQYAPLMAAIECIHAYSLIHDDLPSMDDDDLRRGQPTCHIQFDEGMAILAGDALQTMAFDVVLHNDDLPETSKVACLKILSQASGFHGMCGGQAIDLAHTDRAIDLATLEQLHRLKTGALLNACVAMPMALCPSISDNDAKHLLHFAQLIGLAFQVQDDILDVTSSSETLGKPSGSDEAANKSTFPALLGLQGAQDYLATLLTQALSALEQIPYNSNPLQDFAQYIIKRNY
jgi:farnesyl diphosphate synthase